MNLVRKSGQKTAAMSFFNLLVSLTDSCVNKESESTKVLML